MEETLKEIAEWVAKQSAPNDMRKYSTCPICCNSWWDDKECHNFWCWVPRLQDAVELAQRLTTQQGSEPEEICPSCRGTGESGVRGVVNCIRCGGSGKLLPCS